MLKPLHSNVVIEPIEVVTETASGIIYVTGEAAESNHQEGVVVAIGPGERIDGKPIGMSVSVGDRVIYTDSGFTIMNVEHEGKDLIIVDEHSILAVVE